MRTITSLLLALALGAGASVCLPARAAERLAVGANFTHIFEEGADGQWRGLGVDVLRLLAARAGDTISFKMYPWSRAQAMVEHAQADILIGPYKSLERQQHFDFLDLPFYRDRMLFYVRRGSKITWQGDLTALRSRRIAAVHGWHYGPQFDRLHGQLDLSEVPMLENGVQMLALGRVDLLATNERNTAQLVSSLQLDKLLTILCPDITQLDGYLAFPRDSRYAIVRSRYNALFAEMVRSGELARLGARNGVLVPAADGAARNSASCGDQTKVLR